MMIKLSDRLSMLASEINKGETMADIGTDHGFLPIYLAQNDISPFVVLGDVSKATWEKSKIHAGEYLPHDKYSCRLGNGFEILEYGEMDSIVIAGMGAKEMGDIIGNDLVKSRSFSKMVLQPRKDVGFLRYFLTNNGFTIEKEQLVRENKYICEILTVRPLPDLDFMKEMKDVPVESIRWEIPLYYRDKKEDLAIELIARKIKREKRIVESKKFSAQADSDINNENIEYLERILRRK